MQSMEGFTMTPQIKAMLECGPYVAVVEYVPRAGYRWRGENWSMVSTWHAGEIGATLDCVDELQNLTRSCCVPGTFDDDDN